MLLLYCKNFETFFYYEIYDDKKEKLSENDRNKKQAKLNVYCIDK